ncbi:hypothetical protein GPECTOR_2g1184 [Gonium pectorale]|uniref:Serpin domain-containing protein n=1 Tax=Gonium pectorale TaxID=33097 RepID=A0A150H0S0_GONPE|nr:hypothetical protein GPECTOR_2g1184 [Gonium pectorale]|eukprot:KXZ55634.1 hypothetical protein GPECTOR_2g1184 [Gonium pectorale]
MNSDSQTATFTTSNGSAKDVDMMKQEFKAGSSVLWARKAGVYDAVALPYSDDNFSAVALLPAQGVEGFEPIRGLILRMPRFKVTSRLSLVPTLAALGVRAAFSSGADFSRMSTARLQISEVVHQAVVDVDEQGTVAAAATAVVMVMSVGVPPPPPPELVFDRPFAFIIRHNPTGLPVFIGAVNDPSTT